MKWYRFYNRYFQKLPRALVLLLLAAVALLLFGWIAHEVIGEGEQAFDERIFRYLRLSQTSSRLLQLMKGFTYLASRNFLLCGYGVLIIGSVVQHQYRQAAEQGVIGFSGFLLNYFMKLFYHRSRPADPLIDPLQNFSFPSGHATSAAVFYGLLVYRLWNTNLSRTMKWVLSLALLVLVLLIGFSRVYLRVHYPSDVIAGFCTGMAWIGMATWILEWLKGKNGIKKGQQELQMNRPDS